jgi:hypothetical protein
VEVTSRDAATLRFAGDQYAIPTDVYRVVLGRARAEPGTPPGGPTERVARRRADRLAAAGLARRERILGVAWLIPTRRGLEFAGLPYDPWEPVGWKLAHVAAVARLRLALEAAYPGSTWRSERAIRHYWQAPERKGARVRIPDGALALVSGAMIGIELELHPKAAHRYGPIVADVDPGLDEVWWFTTVPGWLERTLLGVSGSAIAQRVQPIPEGVIR